MRLAFLIIAPIIYWTAVDNADSYDVRYSLQPINDATWECATQLLGAPVPSAVGDWDSCVVPAGGYFFAVRVVNAFGESNVSNNVKDVKCDTTNDERLDITCDRSIDISDLVWMIDYMFEIKNRSVK